jgi:hypothetical protein
MEVWYFSPTCTPNLPLLSFCVMAYEHKENCYLYWPLYERTRWSKIRQCPGQFIGFNPNSCFSTWNWNQLIFSKDNKPISQILKSLTNISVLLNGVKTQKQDSSFIWELGCSSELDCCIGGTQLLVQNMMRHMIPSRMWTQLPYLTVSSHICCLVTAIDWLIQSPFHIT